MNTKRASQKHIWAIANRDKVKSQNTITQPTTKFIKDDIDYKEESTTKIEFNVITYKMPKQNPYLKVKDITDFLRRNYAVSFDPDTNHVEYVG
jgi:hypothetical protein